MGNAGGDQGDGTVMIPRCPECHEIFYDPETMKQHIEWENGRNGYSDYRNSLRDVLKGKI